MRDTTDTTPVRLAHLTDVHLPDILGFWPRYWNLKRVLGWLNWQRRRRFVHKRETVDKLIAHLKSIGPTHTLISGDLINIGLPEEYKRAAGWLEGIGAPDEVYLVTGNHDIYTPISARSGVGHWAAYLAGDTTSVPDRRELDLDFENRDFADRIYPHVRRIGPVDLISLNSAVPTRPGDATGLIGPKQIERLADFLREGREAVRFRLVMLHHPPLSDQATMARGLRDTDDFRAVLEKHGAELVIFGHNHVHIQRWLDGPDGQFPLVGLSSATVSSAFGHEDLAAYQIYEVARDGGDTGAGFRLQVIRYGLRASGGDVVELANYALTPDRDDSTKQKGTVIEAAVAD